MKIFIGTAGRIGLTTLFLICACIIYAPGVLGRSFTPSTLQAAPTCFISPKLARSSPPTAIAMAAPSDVERIPVLLSATHHLGQDKGQVGLILASKSPRRVEILDMMGLKGRFTAKPSPLDEEKLQNKLKCTVPAQEYTKILAEEKAKALAIEMAPSCTQTTLVLGSDTIVELEGLILEKPRDTEEAKGMLSYLSGKGHSVHTGVAVFLVLANNMPQAYPDPQCVTKVTSFTETAFVNIAPLTKADIDAYIATGDPLDKAGSYGIQGLGGQLVQKVDGDFFTVMGLPMHKTSAALADAVPKVVKLINAYP